MLTNGNTPVSKSAAQQRYAERKAQPAQQGDNAVAVQQQSGAPAFASAGEMLAYRCLNAILAGDPALLADVQEALRKSGAEPDPSLWLLEGPAKYFSHIVANISTFSGREIRDARDSLKAYVESELLGPVLRMPLCHITAEVRYENDGYVIYGYRDELKLEVCKFYTTIRQLGEVIKENGNSQVLTTKPGASVEETTGFSPDPAGYRPLPEVVNENLGITFTQQHRGGACASMIKGQQETGMAETSMEEAQKIRYTIIKYPLISIIRGLYLIKQYGYLDLLNWHVPYITQPFPMGDFKSIAKFDVMIQKYSNDFYATYLGKDGVSEKFLKEYGDTPVQVYFIRRAHSTAGANKALSLPTTCSSRDAVVVKDAKVELVKLETEVKTEPEAKEPAARKATKKTTSSKAKAKTGAKAAEEVKVENQDAPF